MRSVETFGARPYMFILDEHGNPQPCSEVISWAQWFETADLTIAHDRLGCVGVSTVFLGVDRSLSGDPILWETMIFGGIFDGRQTRYHPRAEAIQAHREIVDLLRRFVGKSRSHIRKIIREYRQAALRGH